MVATFDDRSETALAQDIQDFVAVGQVVSDHYFIESIPVDQYFFSFSPTAQVEEFLELDYFAVLESREPIATF